HFQVRTNEHQNKLMIKSKQMPTKIVKLNSTTETNKPLNIPIHSIMTRSKARALSSQLKKVDSDMILDNIDTFCQIDNRKHKPISAIEKHYKDTGHQFTSGDFRIMRFGFNRRLNAVLKQVATASESVPIIKRLERLVASEGVKGISSATRCSARKTNRTPPSLHIKPYH
ncbi:unnamed protein product, partial [Didymodactylos carnosus]